jgi:predicted regulator of Ras-like GTPase activity (Roadblock/LC7/MglB family)
MKDSAQASDAGLRGSLDSLLAIPGVLAGMVATDDGLPLAARLRSELDEDALAAAAAVLGQLGARTLDGMGRGELTLVVLDSSRFRFIVQPLAIGYLMVVTEPNVEPDPVTAEVISAAAHLGRTTAELAEHYAV